MILYHCLPRKYLTEQIKGDKFYSYHDRQPYAKQRQGSGNLGIWCTEHFDTALRASQYDDDLVVLEINTDIPKRKTLRYENHGDFLDMHNGDYYILREKKIPLAHVNILEVA